MGFSIKNHILSGGWSNLKKGINMEKIVLKKVTKEMKTKRHAVTVQNETYIKLMDIQTQTGMTMESLVNLLLEEAIKNVEIQ